MYQRTQGLILRSWPSGEFDFLVRAASPEWGLMTLRLRGARRPRARLRFLKEPAVLADLHFYGKPSQDKIPQLLTGTLSESFAGLRESWPSASAARDLLKFMEIFLTPFDARAEDKFCLLCEALASLSSAGPQAGYLLSVKLKVLELSGWKLSASDAARSGLDTASLRLCEELENGRLPANQEPQSLGKLERLAALYVDRLVETAVH